MSVQYYKNLVQRNKGFISDEIQEKMKNCRLLIAGCGLGSMIAECAVRAGFTHITLADGDVVEPHNLNRQIYCQDDIGNLKANQLSKRLSCINHHADIRVLPFMLKEENIPDILENIDLVIDSIDFLDADAILSLHVQARKRGLNVIAPLAVGWGCAAFVFSPQSPSLADLAGLGDINLNKDRIRYAELFLHVLESYSECLPNYVVRVIRDQLNQIRERKPCPISQLAGGTFSAAALSIMLASRVLANEAVPLAPEMIVFDPVEFQTKQLSECVK